MTTGDLVVVVVLGLAAYRITRLLVLDSLLEPGRTKLHDSLESRNGFVWEKLYELLSCTWCAGFWVSAVLFSFYTWKFFFEWSRYEWITLFAITGLQGLLHALEPDEE